ncbi:MAG: hypothetical protein WBC44_15765 [Planctomycetaceae bacterium]
MDERKLRRPLWMRKRWIAVAALLLASAYPASIAPLAYAVGRGWLEESVLEVYSRPVYEAVDWWGYLGNSFYELGRRHHDAAHD